MKNANFMASLKAFFGKAWTATKAFSIKAGKWIVANKLISIPVAVVLVGGIACAIALPIALHEHDFATEWSTDADNHWHSAICSHEEEKSDLGAHAYDNACDTTCNVCGATRTVGAHAYDNDCDTTCNICGAIRTVGAHAYDNACDTTCNICGATRTVGAHAYDNDCDTTCNICGATRTVGAHVYDNACDTTCNVCGATRAITHDHADTLTAGDTTHYYLCSVCGDKKDEVAHVFDKTVASSEYLKEEATATTKAQYYKSCVCGKASATEYFETDKTAGTLANIQDLSKTYDKVELANPTYETNSDGAVTIEWYQGDTKLDAKPVNAGTYKVKVIIAESATYAGISAEKEFTIANKVLSNLSFEFVYSGESNFDTDYLTEAQGILAADVADGIFIFVQFDSKNVGATVTDKEIDFGEEADSYENYEIDIATFTASIVPKTLNYLEITKVYNGKRGFGENAGIYCQLGVENGVIAGDTVFLETCDDIEYNVGTYTLTRANSGENNDTVWLYGADAGNYDFQGDANDYAYVVGEITVTKRSVWAENVEFTYDGYTNWSGEESPNQIVFQNMANGETMDSSFVEWTFDSINVDATLTSVEFMDEDDGRSNYEIDFSKCTASIIPRVIDNLTYAFEYNGMEYHQAVISKNEHSGIVGDDQISLEVCFATPNVGSALDIDGEFGFEPGFVEDNYVLGENYSFSIVPAKLTLKAGQTLSFTEDYRKNKAFTMNVDTAKFDGYVGTASQMTITVTTPSDHAGTYSTGVILSPYNGPHNVVESKNYDFSEIDNATFTIRKLDLYISMTVEYNGSTEFAFDNYLLTPANTDDGNGNRVYNGDVVYLDSFEVDSADITSEIFVYDYVLSGEDAENYYIDEFAVEITKKKLTNLEINVTEAVYDVPGVDGSETATLTLLVKDGIIPGETVEITVTNYAQVDLWNGTFELCLKSFETLTQGQEIVALVASGDYANYELVADANGVVGILNIVASCDVQHDGSCNCGTSHLIGTAASSDIRTTLPCATTWTGGVYKISTLAGYWSIIPSDNFADITAIYDANGNEVEIDANDAGFYAEAGTYYVHIGKASDLGTAQNIVFTHTHTLANLGDDAAKSDLITAKSGDAIYFRIENDAPWGASMNVFSDNETTLLDSSKYTVKVYDEDFKELTGVIYDGTDVTHSTDDYYSVVGKTIYIEVLLSADTNVQIYIY